MNYKDLGITEADIKETEYYLVEGHPVKFITLKDGRAAAFSFDLVAKEFILANNYLSIITPSAYTDREVVCVNRETFNSRVKELME